MSSFIWAGCGRIVVRRHGIVLPKDTTHVWATVTTLSPSSSNPPRVQELDVDSQSLQNIPPNCHCSRATPRPLLESPLVAPSLSVPRQMRPDTQSLYRSGRCGTLPVTRHRRGPRR